MIIIELAGKVIIDLAGSSVFIAVAGKRISELTRKAII